jgi:zinc transporter
MEDKALVSAILLDGKGGGKDCTEEEISRWTPDQGTLWLHFNYSRPDIMDWLIAKCGLDEITAKALTAEEPRPRSHAVDNSLLLVLRGVNLNPNSDLMDMVAIRAWIEPRRIITARNRTVMAAEDVRHALNSGSGPKDVGGFLVQLCERITLRVDVAITEIEEAEDVLEDQVLDESSYGLRPLLSDLRRRLINLRRYLSPQRQVLNQLQFDDLSWLDKEDKQKFREIADHLTRYVEELDATRDRAAIAQDELESRLAEQMNKNMYVLSVVAAIFLPLSLLTGLLGINVLGIPGANNPYGFYIVCAVLAGTAAVQYWLFRKRKVI